MNYFESMALCDLGLLTSAEVDSMFDQAREEKLRKLRELFSVITERQAELDMLNRHYQELTQEEREIPNVG
jgi:hypothetical protein